MKKKYNGVCVKVYFNPKDFADVAESAEKAGKRRVGLPLFTQKKHGFSHEKVANTDKLAKFLKFCWKYWEKTEAERIQKLADIARKEKEMQEEKRRLGY